ncbi:MULTISPECIES: PEP/pyruvate-binding domain-containing protein [unclassified Streptomyces]|uniref:PEP/pyruvate-binding domain-containing protein n=1 Tax=unclassified Streptomyces TaxID=2593676 RepID=UPI00056197E5|nr:MULTISPECIES: PEP/pyruvate-binding domain-containing protein [unclassified Streptomyces]MYT28571.1 phosphoenolpyruvate synthase [Streptomyces sp. SID8354]
MHDVVMLRDLRAGDATRVGAKAANLGELMSAGIPVPDGFCLPLSVYRTTTAAALGPQLDHLTTLLADGSQDREIEDCARLLRTTILTVEFPEPLLDELAQAYQAVRPDGGGVAVRSSGTSEDSATASFAGQYHTELAVDSPEDVVTAVRRCWASLWQVHAIRYRERQHLPHSAAGMAVVVQAMVPAESAGVMFTVDPRATTVTDGAGDPPPAGRTVIESSWGYGEAVVGGLVTPDRFEVSRADARVAHTQVAHKLRMVVPAATAGEGGYEAAGAGTGTAVVDVPSDRRDAASLTADQAVALARYGRTIEEHFGAPQDVEWAVRAGRIAILQARPLTQREPARTAPADVRWQSPVDGAWWARISICDSWLPEPLSPLFATTLFPCLVTHWSQNWAGPEAEQLTNPLLPKPMSGTINGFAYLRLDYPMNKYPLRTVKLALNCYRFHLGPLERRWRTVILPRHVARLEAMRRTDLTALATDDLLRLIAEAQELSGKYWAILGGLAWYWNIGEWLLATVYPRIAKPLKDSGTELPGHGALLQGYPSMTSETTFALHDIARTEGDDGEAEREFEKFLDRYGHQVYHLDFVEPTPAEDPSTFRTTIAAYREGRAADPRERMRSLAQRRTTARAQVAAALRAFPLRRGVLTALLSWNRRYGQVRDQALFHFTRGWPIMRRAYLELGRRLTTAGGLRSPDDVFFLTGDELHGELRKIGRGQPPKSWDDVVHQRRAHREEQKLLSPPPQVPADARIFMGKVDVTSVALVGHQTKAEEGAGLHGSPVSPGRVTAPARRVFSVRDFPTFQAGDVLVAPYITPAWSPLLAIAGGVVTDTGGALSHGSIVAREYGIPAVMGTNNATKLIQDGQLVTVDGDHGRVY